MAALTKADLAEYLFVTIGLNKREATDVVEQFFEEIRAALSKGEEVMLSSFGRFNLQDKNPRPGRNPKTGDVVPITARRVVKFKASHRLLQLVQKYLDKSSS